ncbi:MAG: aspartate carbamoyltransferase regulatory subunit [Lachnospiraceae bacterium]|nr:aspartate carbamoyltransferase regulatory subunit [Lachnospiraceae bacterium]
MINVGAIKEGYVLDHIQAGMALQIYNDLNLKSFQNCPIAIITNVSSKTMGRKDILKVECPIGTIDLDVLGFLDHNITVNVIENETIVEKKKLQLPKQIKNVIQCKNPRCITSIEQELDQIFYLSNEEKEIYRCKYCDEKYRSHKRNKLN